MTKVRSSRAQKLHKGKTLIKSSGKGGLRKIACMRCKIGVATPSQNNDGKKIHRCNNCGAVFSLKAF